MKVENKEKELKLLQGTKLELARKKLFEGMEIECYVDISHDNGDFYMTRKQIGEALEYKNEKQLNVVIFRHKEIIGESVGFKLKSTDEKYYETEVYTFRQLFQILRFSKQPKADLFMEWAVITLEELVTGRAELKFSKSEDKAKYEERIYELESIVLELQDKANGYDKVLIAPNCQEMNSVAKVLEVGRNKLFAWLRKEKILMKNNVPYQRHINAKHFEVKDVVIPTGEVVPKTIVTGKGLDYIRKKLEKINYQIG